MKVRFYPVDNYGYSIDMEVTVSHECHESGSIDIIYTLPDGSSFNTRDERTAMFERVSIVEQELEKKRHEEFKKLYLEKN